MLVSMKITQPIFIAMSAMLLASCGSEPSEDAPTPAQPTADAAKQISKLVTTNWIVGDSSGQAILRMQTARTKDERMAVLSSSKRNNDFEGYALIGTNQFGNLSVSDLKRPYSVATVSEEGRITSLEKQTAGSKPTINPPAGTIAILLIEDSLLGSNMIKVGAKAHVSPTAPSPPPA